MKYVLPDDSDILTKDALIRPANATLDEIQHMLRRCKDADVVFLPVDPVAHDNSATGEDEAAIAWTLGHIIVHLTATTEESAAIAAELARGVAYHGRSRSEVPWQTVKTVEQCRARLKESRWMRLASLNMWPDQPDLVLVHQPWDNAPDHNATKRFMMGVRHEAAHLDQIRDVITQARTYRRRQTWWWRLLHRDLGRSARVAASAEATTSIVIMAADDALDAAQGTDQHEQLIRTNDSGQLDELA